MPRELAGDCPQYDECQEGRNKRQHPEDGLIDTVELNCQTLGPEKGNWSCLGIAQGLQQPRVAPAGHVEGEHQLLTQQSVPLEDSDQ